MNKSGKTVYSGAALRQLREQREAYLASPAGEARRREESFLKNLASAQDDFEWILDNEAWLQLGFETFTDWYEARVATLASRLGLRPAREQAKAAIEKAAEEQKALPRDQRKSQRELAKLFGVSQATVSRAAFDSNESEETARNPVADPLDSIPDEAKVRIAARLAQTSGPAATSPAGGSAENTPAGLPAVPDAPKETDSAGEDRPEHDHPGTAGLGEPAEDAPTPIGSAGGTSDPENGGTSPVDSGSDAGREQDPAGVTAPAPAPAIPSWLRSITAVCAAVHDLSEEDPLVAAAGVEDDLAAVLGSAVSTLTKWYRQMQEAK